MTTSAAPTAADLQADLDAAREHTRKAEQALGAAGLEGKATKKLTDALDDAHAQERGLELAIAEAERRQTEAEAEAASAADRQERVDVYRSIPTYLDHVEKYVTARAALDEAESALRSNPPHELVRRVKGHFLTFADRRLAAYDRRLLSGVPRPPSHGSTVEMPDPKRFTPAKLAEMKARAIELAEAAERDEDASIAVTPAEERRRSTRRRRIQAKEARQHDETPIAARDSVEPATEAADPPRKRPAEPHPGLMGSDA